MIVHSQRLSTSLEFDELSEVLKTKSTSLKSLELFEDVELFGVASHIASFLKTSREFQDVDDARRR